jgi:hypothetical protein
MDMPNHGLITTKVISSTLFFWWIAFLRKSRDYWWICQQQGECLDSRLVSVWREFGDIYKYPTLSQWWHENAARLFDSPQMEMDFDNRLSSGLKVLNPTKLSEFMSEDLEQYLCIAIPINLDLISLNKEIVAIFELARIRGTHNCNGARYLLKTKIKPQSLKNIINYYCALSLKQTVVQSESKSPIHNWGDYEIGRYLKLAPQYDVHQGDSMSLIKKKQQNTRIKQSQHYKSALNLIANVEIGKFPYQTEVEYIKRWTSKQSRDLQKAIDRRQWQPVNWLDREHSFLLPENAIDQNGVGVNSLSEIRLIDDFRSMMPPQTLTKHEKF